MGTSAVYTVLVCYSQGLIFPWSQVKPIPNPNPRTMGKWNCEWADTT